MTDSRTMDELKQAATGKPASDEIVALYRRAFDEFGALALWSSRAQRHPTAADALAIAHSLRVEGNMAARRLAERIEELCRAAL